MSNMSGPLYVDGVLIQPGGFLPRPGRTFYLSAGGNNGSGIVAGSDSYTGKSWDQPFLTLDRFLDDAKTFDRLYLIGDIREEALIGSNLAFDVQIIGCGALHHPDVPSSSYHPGSSMIRPPASPTAATDLITVRGRGWEWFNINFDAPVDASAVVGIATNDSGTSEYDASHMRFHNCMFQQGKYGFTAHGGLRGVVFNGCQFMIMSISGGSAIRDVAGAGVRANQFWRIIDCEFPSAATAEGNKGNASHIIVGLNSSKIKGSTFGTVESTAKYIDLTGGQDNVVEDNTLGGVYDTTDYVAGTGDLWYGNRVAAKAVTAPDGLTLTVPGA